MSYIALLVVALIGALYLWFQKPEIFTGLEKYVQQTEEEVTSTNSGVMKPVNLTFDIARKSDIDAIQAGLLQYQIENGRYPDNLGILIPAYLAEVRKDPKTHEPYEYRAVDNGRSYELCVYFETTKSRRDACISPD